MRLQHRLRPCLLWNDQMPFSTAYQSKEPMPESQTTCKESCKQEVYMSATQERKQVDTFPLFTFLSILIAEHMLPEILSIFALSWYGEMLRGRAFSKGGSRCGGATWWKSRGCVLVGAGIFPACRSRRASFLDNHKKL